MRRYSQAVKVGSIAAIVLVLVAAAFLTGMVKLATYTSELAVKVVGIRFGDLDNTGLASDHGAFSSPTGTDTWADAWRSYYGSLEGKDWYFGVSSTPRYTDYKHSCTPSSWPSYTGYQVNIDPDSKEEGLPNLMAKFTFQFSEDYYVPISTSTYKGTVEYYRKCRAYTYLFSQVVWADFHEENILGTVYRVYGKEKTHDYRNTWLIIEMTSWHTLIEARIDGQQLFFQPGNTDTTAKIVVPAYVVAPQEQEKAQAGIFRVIVDLEMPLTPTTTITMPGGTVTLTHTVAGPTTKIVVPTTVTTTRSYTTYVVGGLTTIKETVTMTIGTTVVTTQSAGQTVTYTNFVTTTKGGAGELDTATIGAIILIIAIIIVISVTITYFVATPKTPARRRR